MKNCSYHVVHFFAVDMLGHGDSHYGTENAPVSEQLQALEELIRSEIIGKGIKNLLVLGRSYGGKGATMLLEQMYEEGSHHIHGLILIAPAVGEAELSKVPRPLASIPVLAFWAEDDPFVPPSK